MMLIGTVVTAAGFLFMARIHSLLTFYLAFGVIALGISMASFITTTTVVGNWFSKYRSRAMTIATSGGGLGGIMAPFLVWAIATYGWRSVLDWIAIGTLLVGIPTSLVMRRRPEDYGYLPDGQKPDPSSEPLEATQGPDSSQESSSATGASKSSRPSAASSGLTLRQILKTPAFWQLTLGMGLSGLAMSTVVVFSIPALESFGISSTAARLTLMFISIINLLGRFVLGFLADMVDKRWVLAVTYVMIGLGTLAFAAVHQLWQVVFFLALYPAGHGGTVPVRLALLGDYFGRRSFGSMMGLTMTLTAIFGIVGPIFTGWMFDVTGSYRWAFIIIGLLVLPGIPMTLMAKAPLAISQVAARP